MKIKYKLFLFIVISFVFCFLLPKNVFAAIIYSNSSTGNDTTGDGTSGNPYKTFHKGYTSAAANDTLNLTGTFTWTDADETGDVVTTGYTIGKNLTIQGQSASTTIIQAASTANSASSAVFNISAGYTVAINDVTIRYGYNRTGSSGGGINNEGTLTVNRCAVSYNYVWYYPSWGGYGGGIRNAGTLTVNNSTINNNFAQSQGGGIVNAYTAAGNNIAYITNSTIAFNSTADVVATVGGAGIFLRSGTVYVTNCTIAYNVAPEGTGDTTGIDVEDPSANLYIKNSIVAHNKVTVGGVDQDVNYASGNFFDLTAYGSIHDNGGNVFGKVNSAYNGVSIAASTWYDLYGNSSGDNVYTLYGTATTGSLFLDTVLADNSATTGTQTLAITSATGVSVNNGLSSANGPVSIPASDQRGAARNSTTDVGSYEYAGIMSFDPPTTQSSSLTFSSVSYNQMTISWANGDGTARAVFVKQANSGTATPVDITTYTANTTFGSGTQIGSSGWYAVYNGTGTNVTITGLTPSTDYITQVFEYNGGAGYENYLTDSASDNPKSQATIAVNRPTVQSYNLAFSSVQYTQIGIGWTNGNGEKRVVFIKQANTGTATPVDNATYTANTTFGNGTQIGTSGWYAVYNSTGTSVTVTGLTAGTDYVVQVFEYNGSAGIENYFTDTAVNNPKAQTSTAVIEPTNQAYSLTFSSVQYTQIGIGWTNGNGDKRVVFVKQANTGTAVPVDNTSYTANTAFGSGTQIGSSGWYTVYNGTGTSVTVTGLTAQTDYIVQVFEYNESGSTRNYFLDTATNNPKSQASATVTEPTVQATAIGFSSVQYTQIGIGWTNGNGAKRIVFIKQGNSGTAVPIDNTNYTANTTFGSGTQIGTSGWYCVYSSTGTSVTVTGLTLGTDYIAQVFEYNESGAIVNYFIDLAANNPKSQATASVTEPTSQATNIIFSSVTNNQMGIGWTNGNGSSRMVFIKQANTGTAVPVDNTSYTANTAFGSGTQIGSSGWYAIYSGTGTSVTVTGLSQSTDYIAQVFEYNSSGETINYFVDSAANNPKSQATTSAPTVATLGTGTSTTGSSEAAPVNIWYRSLHGQSIYTAAELNAAGVTGPIYITQVGFYINSVPLYALPNFVIRMKHTTDTTVANWQSVTGMTTVYSAVSYTPTAGGFDMRTLSTPFTWNGTDNLVIDTAFSQVLPTYDTSGTVRYYSLTNGYRYAKSDGSDQTNVFSGGGVSSSKPQLRLTLQAIDSTPPTITSVSSDKTNSSYKAGEIIDIDVTFSEAVTSTGNVTVTLETGEVDRTCTFTVTNSTTGTCNYTVQAGDTSSDLDIVSISGTVNDQSNNSMSNFVPTTSLAANKAIIIDTTVPSTPTASPVGNTYTSVQAVSLSSAGGSAIYYTTNGSTPTTSSTLYTSAISVGSSTTIKALAIDAAGNESGILTANYTINLDPDAPVVSNVSASATSNSVTITWETNEDASSQVEYGLTSSYGNATTETDISSRVVNHAKLISNLRSCVRYYYRVKSKDSNNNQGISSQYSFNTSGCVTSSISTGNEAVVPVSGGSVSLTNNRSTALITAPNNFATESATIQLNKLNPSSIPTAPSNTSLVKENIYDLVAVSESDTVISSFSEPVVYVITYGSDTESSYIEDSLGVYKYNDGLWTDQNCVLDTTANTLTCSLNSFSVYGVFGQEVASTSGSSSFTSVSSSASAPVCNDAAPVGTPDLFQIDTKEDQATIYFTPVSGIKKYFVSYSVRETAEEHGTEINLGSEGVQEYTVNYLSPLTVYYFKVRGQNGCMPGNWSKIVKVTTKGKRKTEPSVLTPTIISPAPESVFINWCPYMIKPRETVCKIDWMAMSRRKKSIDYPWKDFDKTLLGEIPRVKQILSTVSLKINEKSRGIAESVGYSIVNLGYRFISEPTKIYDVKVLVLSPTQVKVSWRTNHPANGKVNFGYDRTYPFDVQSEERVTYHEFILENLTPDTLYHFEVMSQDKTYIYDANREFRTPKE